MTILSLSAAVAAGVLLLAGVGCGPGPKVTEKASGPQWQYGFLADKATPSFDLRFHLAPQSPAPDGLAARLLIGDGPDDGSFIEIGPQGIFHGKLREGKETARQSVNRMPLAELARCELVLEERPHRWSLTADGRIVASGDEPLGGPDAAQAQTPLRIGCGAAGGEVKFQEVRFQPAERVYFTDSFMRVPEAHSDWTDLRGQWQLSSLRDPLLSANAFQCVASAASVSGAAAETCNSSPAGFSLTLAMPKDGPVEATFAYSPSKPSLPAAPGAVAPTPVAGASSGAPMDYCLLRWTGPAAAGSEAVLQLVRKNGGVEDVLAERPGGYAPGKPCTASLAEADGAVVVSVNGEARFAAPLSQLPPIPVGRFLTGATVAGDWFWSDLTCNVACRPAKGGAAGMYVCWRGPEDYYLFRWTCNDSGSPGARGDCRATDRSAAEAAPDSSLARTSGVKQFIRRNGASETVLAESSGGYVPDQWYTMRTVVGSGWAEVSLDEMPIFLVRDPGLTHGKIGLHVEGPRQALFDDVAVESRGESRIDFSKARLDDWLRTGGAWMPLAPAEWDRELWPGGIAVQATDPARLLWGDASWRDYEVSARLEPWEKGSMGICFRYQDERNFYLARIRKASAPVIEILRREDDKETVLASAPAPEDLVPHQMTVATDDGGIVVSLDRIPVLRTADYAFLRGRAGLFAQGVDGARFSEVTLGPPPARPAVVSNVNEAFEAETAEVTNERSMQIWSGALSDWLNTTATPPDSASPVEIWQRRLDFYGDVHVDLNLAEPPIPADPQKRIEVGLLLNTSDLDQAKDGTAKTSDLSKCVTVRLSGPDPTPDDRWTFKLEILADGRSLDSAPLEWDSGALTLRVSRVGDVISAGIAGRKPVVWASRPAAPADGRRVAWYESNVKNSELALLQANPSFKSIRAEHQPIERATVAAKGVTIYSDNVMDYTFNNAPTDWRVGNGTWEVTNRWQCDPRWSFFSGRDEGLAVLWNKRPLRGDFLIEYYVGEKMNRERGSEYQYAKDLNISVCTDGSDLTSGYSFLFGGFDNTFTGICRGKERWGIPEAGRKILIERSSGIHRKWFHVAVSRKGSTLEMRVDDKLVLSKTDSAPLSGSHWAIWTRNNGIMVGRVRVCAEGIGRCDSTDQTWAATSQGIY